MYHLDNELEKHWKRVLQNAGEICQKQKAAPQTEFTFFSPQST
jgi:hypothetical protein